MKPAFILPVMCAPSTTALNSHLSFIGLGVWLIQYKLFPSSVAPYMGDVVPSPLIEPTHAPSASCSESVVYFDDVENGRMRVRRFCAAIGLVLLAACAGDEGAPRSRGSGAAGTAAPGASNSTHVLIAPSAGAATGGGSCKAGHYVGSFDGLYNSAAWGNGAAPLTIAAVPSMGRPGLEFWLEESAGACAPGAEFCADFTVKGGKIRGFADPFSDGDSSSTGDGFALAIRFEIDFGGELDCARGQFRGLLQNGCYDVATILFRFEGVAPGTYDPATSSFVDGQWMVKEMPMEGVLFPPDASIGGMGSWNASLALDNAAPVAQGGGFCAHAP
jgi:hypothetical protein